ncbi:Sec34-like family-domain-containing protein [Schizophyllum amplum]|uniref:Conserved oligomeric Golgi complex subunit 3 n=1 Tax=Schizophyllum amplum TaxID=97359 RepID=A0A550CZZ0_9AGAR|nr:Sec34-like family-domain-containing protein [Auriculariopsis ampla]
MASRGASRRGTPTISLTTKPKPNISVEEWEAKAPLGEIEIRSVGAVKAASERVPLPPKVRRLPLACSCSEELKFTADDKSVDGSSRPSTPVVRARLPAATTATSSSPRPGTPHHPLHPKQPIQTPQQFYDWFALVDREIAHSQEAHFRAHVASVAKHLAACDGLVEKIDDVDGEVASMLEGWRTVEEGGKSLKDACERLLQERERLLDMTEQIGARLEYFQELEHATRMLNNPGDSLVLQTDFLYMVERVDICIDYLKNHRQYREAEVYLLRFQQCMTRAMTLIRMYFVGSLRALSTDDVSPTAQMHLLYTRFKTVASQMAPLLGELERRAQVHPAELAALLAECHTAFFSTRKALLVGRVTEEIRGLDPGRTELVELTRAGCSYLKQLCTDEFDLYREFFSTGEEQLYQYLENLCDYLYDDLRPRILHEPRLTALCEVCTVLQALMVLDVSVAEEEDDESGIATDELVFDFDKPRRRRGLHQLHISHLLQMVLQDAQTRLFFKAQAVIQSDIRYYAPTAEDLAYPDILVRARGQPSAGQGEWLSEKASVSELFKTPSLKKQDTWYPTLRKTVWVLSQLHDFVKPAIFEDIAQEAIGLCRQTLVSAAEMVKRRNPPASLLDGQLFLVRHLLILKEIVHHLSLSQRESDPNTDFAGVTETWTSMLNKTSLLLPDRFLSTLGVSRPEDIKETKYGIDYDLRRACEDVIALCVDPVCDPLRRWVDRVYEFNAARKAQAQPDAPPLAAQDWATQPAAEALDAGFRAACERDLRSAAARLRLYLEDDRTVRVLVDHVQARALEEYGVFREVVWGMYAGGMREGVLSATSLREMLKVIFADAVEPQQAGASGSAT